MNAKTTVLVTLVALAAPAPALADDLPEWCANYKPTKTADDETASEGHGDRAIDLYRYGGWVCQFPKNAKVKKAFESVKQFYMKASGATEDEVKEQLMISAASNEVDRDLTKLPARKQSGKGLVADHMENLVQALLKTDPNADSTIDAKVVWSLDVSDAEPSQLALIRLITSALVNRKALRADGYVLAAMDADKLDRKALDAELEALQPNPVVRASVLHLFFRASHLVAQAKAQLDLRAASDKLVQALLEIPQKAKVDWEKLYAANKDDIDAARTITRRVAYDMPPDDLRKPSQVGCDDIAKRFRAYAAARKPKKPEDLESLVHTDPIAYQLLEASALCDAAEQRLYDAKVASIVLRNENNRTFAGPRMYALSMAYEKANAAAADAAKLHQPPSVFPSAFSVVPPTLVTLEQAITAGDFIRLTSAVYENKERAGQPGNKRTTVEGKVKGVKKTPDGNLVSFKAEKWQAPTEKCTPTGRIAFWAGNFPNPEYDCVVVGYHEESFTQNDLLMPGDLAATLKPDQWVRVLAQDASKDAKGAVILVGKRVGKDVKWTSFLGVPLAGK